MNPLEGVRIVEVTTNASGPLATSLLADQGADVIRLETIGMGDPSRHVGGVRGGVTGYTAYMNRNKRSVAVDLKDDRVRPVLYELIKTADVFVQNSRPGALARAGLGYDALHEINPRLIYASISGFSADGPGAGQRVYDPVIQGASGLASAQGMGEEKPVLVKTIASDKIAAYTAAQAISSALFARERGVVGGHEIHISMLDASLAFLWPDVYWNHSFVGEDFEPKPLIAEFYRVLKTSDGFITAIVVGDEEFKGMCSVLGMEHLQEDTRFSSLASRFANYGELLREAEQRTIGFTRDDLVARMEEAGVPCGRLNTFEEAIEDPRVKHAGSIVEYTHPAGGRMRQARPAAIFDGVPCEVRRPSPALGEHTDEVLASVGCSSAHIAELRAAGVVA